MKKLLPLLCAAAILIIVFGTIYGVGQQVQRSDANLPQIALAQETARKLDSGTPPSEFIMDKIDIATSLQPFLIIYDKSGQVVNSSGYLNEHGPHIPIGVLKSSDHVPYYSVTWQPRNDVRIAAVAVSAQKYYVVSGQSLTEVEKNESHTFLIAVAGCVVSLMVLAGGYILTSRVRR